MNEAMRAGMLEATRLIRARGLLEATVTIQRTLRSIVAPDAAADSPDPTTDGSIEGTFRVIDADSLPSPGSADVRQGPVHGPSTRFRTPRRPHFWGSSEPASRPAPAPGDVVPGERFLTGSYTNQAGTRAYKLYIPNGYHGQTLPLVVMLHGCTQTPDDFAAGHRHECARRRTPVLRGVSRPGACRQWVEMLELVQCGRPAPRPGRAIHHCRYHPPNRRHLPRRRAAGLRGRTISRRGDGRDHGDDLHRSLCGRRHPFRASLRRRPRPSFRPNRDEAGRAGPWPPARRRCSRGGAMLAGRPNNRVPRGSGYKGTPAPRSARANLR